MRQLVDGNGVVQFTQSYEPYGDVLEYMGEGESNYGFAGEWTDATGLQYLRARYYNTGVGRFTTRDTWAGDYSDPLSLNRWMYVQGNPIIFTDPSGKSILGTLAISALVGAAVGGVTEGIRQVVQERKQNPGQGIVESIRNTDFDMGKIYGATVGGAVFGVVSTVAATAIATTAPVGSLVYASKFASTMTALTKGAGNITGAYGAWAFGGAVGGTIANIAGSFAESTYNHYNSSGSFSGSWSYAVANGAFSFENYASGAIGGLVGGPLGYGFGQISGLFRNVNRWRW